MRIGNVGASTFSLFLSAIKRIKQPVARVYVEQPLPSEHDEFIRRRNLELDELERSRFLETRVTEIQSAFESCMENVIFGRDAYVYRHLMSKWFSAICEKYRYDKLTLDDVRSVWLDYLFLLEQVSVSQHLSSQANSHEVKASYRLRAHADQKSYLMIEGVFARQIGEEAVEQLRKVNESQDDAFDRFGKEELAPDGYFYCCVSLEPYKEELRLRQVG